MTTPNHRTATAALDAARPLITRLDAARHPEEVAADLIDAWGTVETSLRALLGGSALDGQALVGEVRQRGLLDYRHAHDLLGFLAARDRATRPDYRLTGADVDAARAGFQSLEAALGVGIGAPTGVHQAVGPFAPGPRNAPGQTGVGAPPAGGVLQPPPPRAIDGRAGAPADIRVEPVTEYGTPPRRRAPSRSLLVVALVALAVIAAGAFWWAQERGSPRGLQRGIEAYQSGQRDVARREFQLAADDHATLATPHVYLARLAREDGDIPRATSELQRAIQLEPSNALALREMGQLLLQGNQPDLATNFLKRAIEVDGADRVAQGWMACALARQGRSDVAGRFAERAGQGDWSACLTNATPAMVLPPGAPLPAGALPPGGYRPPVGQPLPRP